MCVRVRVRVRARARACGGGVLLDGKFNISLIIIFSLLMYFDVIIDDLNVYLLMLDCQSNVSQWLTKY